MTKIQESILSTIAASSGHMTADQVLVELRQLHPSVSLSTIYRNLNIFAAAGRIRRIQRATGADYYEKNLAPHDHAYCQRCGKVSDFVIPGLTDFLTENFEHPIVSFELLVNYVCPACREK
jgi:Fe2+ or Zn2+ uptake regulation protein